MSSLESLASEPGGRSYRYIFCQTHFGQQWGKRNSGGIAIKRWFKDKVNYTLIGAMDLNGFIVAACEVVKWNETSNTGASGTVDREHFISYVKEYLAPTLGRFEFGEPRSIVVLDNATTHMCEEEEALIRATGAYLLYTAPFSPDLNPIELAFNVYKCYLRRHFSEYENDWFGLHERAMSEVSRDTIIKEFRRCHVPFSNDVLTTAQEKEVVMAALSILL
jgi:transposase